MSATQRPSLTAAVYSPVNAENTLIVSAALSPSNTITPSIKIAGQHLNLPQRSEWFQFTFESIGANFQWTITEVALLTKTRGLR